MSEDYYRDALDWLGQNLDKWQNGKGREIEFLCPIEEVPECVFLYIEEQRRNREALRRYCQTRKALGLNKPLGNRK